ncbi:MAG: YaaA family protein [Erysipelotrichaceae bacterium]
MKIVVSPTKTMKYKSALLEETKPKYQQIASALRSYLAQMSEEDFIAVYTARQAKAQKLFQEMGKSTNAIAYYEGLSFQYMNIESFTEDDFTFANQHLCILSAIYGVLRPSDRIVPYRLEMQAKLTWNTQRLAQFWTSQNLFQGQTILNLASKEYSTVLDREHNHVVDVLFYEQHGEKRMAKATFSKMMRGRMVNAIIKQKIHRIEQVKSLVIEGYVFDEVASDANTYVFVKEIVDETIR